MDQGLLGLLKRYLSDWLGEQLNMHTKNDSESLVTLDCVEILEIPSKPMFDYATAEYVGGSRDWVGSHHTSWHLLRLVDVEPMDHGILK